MIPIYSWPSAEAQARISHQAFNDKELWKQVEKIVRAVEDKGDQALLEYTAALDGCTLDKESLKVKEEEIKQAYNLVSPEFLVALRQAKSNIQKFHKLQKPKDWFDQDKTGSIVGQIYKAINRVGLYVPGGTANYPSSVLMTCLPAVVAGVPEIVMATPPDINGTLPPATLVAAAEAGVHEIYKIGGAQAVAALAYGTDTIPAVDKIVGPGNIYVTLAKKMVFGVVGIDMLAGPSEILVIGDGSISPVFAAADLLSQAEHDRRARAFLVTPNKSWAEQVMTALKEQLKELPRYSIAEDSLTNSSAIIIVKDIEEAFDVVNLVAPEHLSLMFSEPWPYLAKIKNAGSIFMGPYSPESLGDYWAGPNHVLPTGGAARYASPLSVDDFYKRSSIINYTQDGLVSASEKICTLAETEKLIGHGLAVSKRLT
ncbi:MAG: histidinol dehydrogenase [Firmicutes bacterium HGW-Firmicutes-12]|nr:MAG: histidinol dehydrogenase [Firmicutes bacterium HGW-Firmicutes-12]